MFAASSKRCFQMRWFLLPGIEALDHTLDPLILLFPPSHLPSLPEKPLHESFARIFAYAADEVGPVIQMCILREIIQRAGRTPFGIHCSENEGIHPCMNDSPHAHDAGFDGGVQRGFY